LIFYWRGQAVLDYTAFSRIQSIILIGLILVTTVAGSFIYFFLAGTTPSAETIKIGICGDLDNTNGRAIWKGAVLAAEEVNAEGGVLGRDFEIVAEDDDSESLPMDVGVAINAFTRLITLDKADYVIASAVGVTLSYQEICSQHKKILFTMTDINDVLTERVVEDYDKYRYYFRTGFGNETAARAGTLDSILTLRNYTGFNKIGYLYHDFGSSGWNLYVSLLVDSLVENGFEVVFDAMVPLNVIDFTSYLAAAEAAGVEILTTFIVGSVSIPLVREWCDRQSPFVLWGVLSDVGATDVWDMMEGKCNSVSAVGYPVTSGYPLTTKTIPTREAYIERWGESPISFAAIAYDVVRFILPDAMRRADTAEPEALVETLEKTNVETSSTRRFVFTSSHDTMVGENPNDPEADYMLVCYFQWQDGVQVLVYPQELMEATGVTYTFPDWPGPWDNLD
jgi:branched-chain amino acid transport system substrate-binding protein